MQLSWTTFLFEIVNFLVLLWILKIFLYKPVLQILDNRRKTIDRSLTEANDLRDQAMALELKYQSRLNDWELEKQQMLDQLQREIQIERSNKLNLLAQELDDQRKKEAVIEQRKHEESIRHYQQNAHQQGTRFASRLLSSLASAEIENQLFELLLAKLKQLGQDHLDALKNACEAIDQITITSAYPLSDSQQATIASDLNTLCSTEKNFIFEQEVKLMAGLRICIGDWVLRFNLQDELSNYSELGHDNPIS